MSIVVRQPARSFPDRQQHSANVSFRPGRFWMAGLLAASLLAQRLAGLGPVSSFQARARVVIVEDRQSIATFTPRPERVAEMVERGLQGLTGHQDLGAAWRSLISTQDVVGIKVYSAPGPSGGTRPAVIAALIQTLLSSGFAAERIYIWDKQLAYLKAAGFVELAGRYGVQVAGSADAGYDEHVSYDTAVVGRLVWGDLEFGKADSGISRKSHVSKLLTQTLTKIIHVSPLLNHNLAAVSGNLYGLTFGSFDNTLRFEFSTDRLATAMPEMYALPELCEQVALNIVDALICQYQGEERALLHYSSMLGQLRFSIDPVALDLLSIHELNRQRQIANVLSVTNNAFKIYTNASLLELGVSDLRAIDVLTAP